MPKLLVSEWSRAGSVPLHTLRADIDYGFAEAKQRMVKSASKFGFVGANTQLNGTERINQC